MTETAKTATESSLAGRLPEVPDIDGVANFWQPKSMLALAVQHDAEGGVEITIALDAPGPDFVMLFDGTLATERRPVEIRTVYLDRITGIRTLTGNYRSGFGVMIHGSPNRY